MVTPTTSPSPRVAPARASGSAPAATPRLGYRPELDGLRGLSAVVIVLYHFRTPLFACGFLAVDVFFVLSGFLITALLLQERARFGRINLGHFYARRALRLAPALTLMLSAVLLGTFLFPDTAAAAGMIRRQVLYSALYVMNWTEVLGWSPGPSPLAHTWSLAIEEQFYILIPLLLAALLAARVRVGRITLVLGVLMAASTAWRAVGCFRGFSEAYLIRGLDMRADSLLAGCVMAGLFAGGKLGADARAWRGPAVLAAGVLAGAVAFGRPISVRLGGETMIFAWILPVAWAASAVVLGYLLCPNAGGPATAALRSRPVVYLGRLSYGIYLWHVPVSVAVFRRPLPVPLPVLCAVAATISFAAAALSYHVVEQPILRLKKRFAAPAHGADALPPVAPAP